MTLATRTYGTGKRTVRNQLTECPACGHTFAPDESRSKHIADQHGPEDFGLTASEQE